MKKSEIIIASHNKGKITELTQMLQPFGFEVKSARELDLPDIEETGTTFEENACLKAVEIAKQTKMPCLADDSGLCVKALGGRPGVYSARYAPNRDFDKAMDMLLDELAAAKTIDRAAYFACVLVLAFPDGNYKSFEGRVDGTIATAKKGHGGFGYDAIFIPENHVETFAEMDRGLKNKISHRGRALQKLAAYLEQHRPGA